MISPKTKGASLALKGIVIVCAAIGIMLSAAAGAQSFMGGRRVFMYLTIQSNILIALVCAVGAGMLLCTRPATALWYTIKFVSTVAITLTGVVFCFVLAPTLGAYAWIFQNVLTHVVVPVAAIADFFVTGRYGSIRKSSALFVLLPPLAYVVYAGIGYAAGWEFAKGIHYPYFFLNWGSPAGAFGFTDALPFMGCGWWILAILVMLLAVGYGYLVILDRLKKNASGAANGENHNEK